MEELQILLEKLKIKKKGWLETNTNLHDWAVVHKAHATGVIQCLNDTIYYIEQRIKENNNG